MNKIRILITCLFLMVTTLTKAQSDPIKEITNAADISSFLNHNIPSQLKIGQNYSASITMMNTGLTTWNINDGYQLALHNTGDLNQNNIWGVRSVDLPHNVQPFEKVTFNFQLLAPASNGVYNCTWVMARGGRTFGEPTPTIYVDVSDGQTPAVNSINNSEFVQQNIPSSMNADKKYNIFVTFKNSGTSSWLKNGDYKVAILSSITDNVSNISNGTSKKLNRRVEPGESHTFKVRLVAPGAGSYNLQLMMMQGSSYFGAKSNPVMITVYAKDKNKKSGDDQDNDDEDYDDNDNGKKDKKAKKNKKNK